MLSLHLILLTRSGLGQSCRKAFSVRRHFLTTFSGGIGTLALFARPLTIRESAKRSARFAYPSFVINEEQAL